MTDGLPKLTLVLGGASSGKSRFAEQIMETRFAAMTYIATAQAFDADMRAKIDAHIARRGPAWTTFEAPLAPQDALHAAQSPVLFDCLSFWLTNHMLQNPDEQPPLDALMSAFASCSQPVVIVSNDVSGGGVPENALARRFQREQGMANQHVAALADLVVFVRAGLPQCLKGAMP